MFHAFITQNTQPQLSLQARNALLLYSRYTFLIISTLHLYYFLYFKLSLSSIALSVFLFYLLSLSFFFAPFSLFHFSPTLLCLSTFLSSPLSLFLSFLPSKSVSAIKIYSRSSDYIGTAPSFHIV